MIEKMKERKAMMIAGAVIALAVLVLVVIFINSGSAQKKLTGLLDLGQKYLEEMSYEDAILVFDEAIAIDPRCAQAYMGKAQAQYALGQYEEAAATLREGIERVDDSSQLETFLQQILDEIEGEAAEEETAEAEESTVQPEEQAESPWLLLNYDRIVRRVDTEEPTIQLEVLGGDSPENYTWQIVNGDSACITLSETGLVTCLPVSGYATVWVSDDKGRSGRCDVQITDTEDGEESEVFRLEMEDGKEHLTISTAGKEEQRDTVIVGDSLLGAYVYHAGDVLIPEHLTYQGQDISVTAISSRAYYWCNTMESISIPETVAIADEYMTLNPVYYCTMLEKIIVAENNPVLKSVDGVLYSKDGKELISYPAAKSGSTYTIPGEVEKIWPGAFVGCENLEEILVAEGNAYYESIGGVLMDRENQLVAYPIGRKAASYTVPEEIIWIAEDAFYMSDLEEVICRSVENISSESFRQSYNLRRIEGGEATLSIYISGRQLNNDRLIEIAGIDEMQNLEYLGMDFFDYYAIDDEDSEKAGNLQELGGLTSLKRLYISGIQDSSGFTWLKNLSGLEDIQIWSKEIDGDFLSACQNLANLEHIEIGTVKTLSDLSWIENLYALQSFDIAADSIELEDFSQLFELPDLEYVEITNYSERDGLEEWFDAKKAENPDMHIFYEEW